MKTIRKLMLAGAAAATLLLAGCAEGPYYGYNGGPYYYDNPYYAYYGPDYYGGGVVLGRGFYGHGLAHASRYHGGGGHGGHGGFRR